MINFFVMIMWMSGGDALLLGDAKSNTLRFSTRKECEAHFIDVLSDTSTGQTIEKSYVGNLVLRERNLDGTLKFLFTCEEVKF